MIWIQHFQSLNLDFCTSPVQTFVRFYPKILDPLQSLLKHPLWVTPYIYFSEFQFHIDLVNFIKSLVSIILEIILHSPKDFGPKFEIKDTVWKFAEKLYHMKNYHSKKCINTYNQSLYHICSYKNLILFGNQLTGGSN